MTKLKELERRLRDEPDNLGLRVVLAGALHDAGRRDDAVELYRSVALAYRAQGRPQQAITVCRSVLELAPDDAPCRALLAALLAAQGGPEPQPLPDPMADPLADPPAMPSRPSPPRLPRPPSPDLAERPEAPRRSSLDVTPLPTPLPYHVAEPTMASAPRLLPADLPPTLRAELDSYPQIEGIANAARRISAELIAASRRDEDDLAGEVETGRFPRDEVEDDLLLDELSDEPGDGPAGGSYDEPPDEPPDGSYDELLDGLADSSIEATLEARRPRPAPGSPLDQVLRDLADDDRDGDDDPTLPPRGERPARRRAVDDEQTKPR